MKEKHIERHMARRRKEYLYDRKLLGREKARKAAEERIKRAEEIRARAEEARKSAEERAERAEKAREHYTAPPENGKGRGWLWIALIVIAAAAYIWWFFFRK